VPSLRHTRRILDNSHPPFYRWFPDAELNTCANTLDRHVDAGRGSAPALIYDSPVTATKRTFSYSELLALTARFAGVLRDLGVCKGDRVLIYMPMIPEAVAAMLACARIGGVHSVVFGGFAAHELATRIDNARPTVIVSASCGIEPTRLVEYEIAHAGLTELRVVETMHERKAMMADLADGFLALPGGFGTWDEFCEVFTWSQLGIQSKACALLNVEGYYDPMLALADRATEEGFLRPEHRGLLLVDEDGERLLDRMQRFEFPAVPKWVGRGER